ncbi:Caltractin [Holothuria leucospilota]|uniref:Caltractin n=1 Tax=Holothuria leucospilota TaxID=206669 RepID=A0A9Q0YFL1_HOLLE|nr:Caltractin [Holothuria leucospilota]
MPAKTKKRKSKSKHRPKDGSGPDDPIPPIPLGLPEPSHRESLKALLTGEQVDLNTKEFMGCRIATRVFDHLTTHEIRDLKTVFDAFADRRGQIKADSVRRAMRALGFKVNKQEAKEMVADMDLDKNGTIDFSEFLQFIIDRQGTARDVQAEICQGFKMMDYDGTGKLSLENLKRACKEAGVQFSETDVRDMLEEADRNGDNVVDLEEFTAVMLKTNLF